MSGAVAPSGWFVLPLELLCEARWEGRSRRFNSLGSTFRSERSDKAAGCRDKKAGEGSRSFLRLVEITTGTQIAFKVFRRTHTPSRKYKSRPVRRARDPSFA